MEIEARLAILAVGLVLTWAAWLTDRHRRALTDVATTPAAAVFAGHNEVAGRAWSAAPLTSHRGRVHSVWWTYELEEERTHTRTVTTSDGKGGTNSRTETYRQFHTVDERSGSLPALEVVDSSGTVTVQLGGAKVVPRRNLREEFKDDSRLPEGFFKRMFDNRTGKYRETEEVVAVGDRIFVIGDAVLDQDTAVPVLRASLVSTRSEASHVGNRAAAAFLLALLAVGATGAGTALSLAVDQDPGPLHIAAGIAVPAIGLFAAWLVTTYNRLRQLAQSIGKARSLVDVQLRRRHDLVPALAEVVAAHAAHERAVLEAVAQQRAMPAASTSSALSEEAANQTGALRAVLGRAEAHPELGADEAFLRLQQALADTESRIAGSRTFYNDSLTLLRTRAQVFPGSLVARFLHLERHDTIPAAGFERTVEAVVPTFS